eukprot:scaffold2992_cov101-Isochrysis_galbana.AAC.1
MVTCAMRAAAGPSRLDDPPAGSVPQQFLCADAEMAESDPGEEPRRVRFASPETLTHCICVARLEVTAIVGDWRDPCDPNFAAIAAARSARLARCADISFLAKTFAALRHAAEQGQAARRQARLREAELPAAPAGRTLRKRLTPDHLRTPLDASRRRPWWSVALQHSCPASPVEQEGEEGTPGRAQHGVSRRRALKLIRQAHACGGEDEEDGARARSATRP